MQIHKQSSCTGSFEVCVVFAKGDKGKFILGGRVERSDTTNPESRVSLDDSGYPVGNFTYGDPRCATTHLSLFLQAQLRLQRGDVDAAPDLLLVVS